MQNKSEKGSFKWCYKKWSYLERDVHSLFQLYTRIYSKYIPDIDANIENIQVLQDNMDEFLYNLGKGKSCKPWSNFRKK